MIEKLMTLLVGILLALAGWTLTRTYELSTKQSVLLKQVDQLYEIFADRLKTRRIQATSKYRDGREAARLILKSKPDISQLSDIEVISDQTVEQLTKFLNKRAISFSDAPRLTAYINDYGRD